MLDTKRDLNFWLICLAVTPFLYCTIGLFVWPDMTPRLILGELTYSAVVLSFLGGSWWERGAAVTNRSTLWTLLALYPTLVGWVANLIRTIPALWLLTFCFLAIFLVELKKVRTSRPVTDALCFGALIAALCLQVMLWKLKASGLYQ